MQTPESFEVLKFIVDHVNVGIITLNKHMEIVLWNDFMRIHSERNAEQVLGRNLFECFPDLPQAWLSKKIKSVFILKNFAFTRWEQRPYLFNFRNNRPITAIGTESMLQDCTFLPIKDNHGDVEFVSITLVDVTDTGIYQTQLQQALQQVKKMSITDALTGIYNRGFFEDNLSKEYNRVKRYGGQLALILFDIDFFKKVNDNHGHMVGDEVLRNVAKRTQGLLRDSDILGRYGGEEFAIILPGSAIEGAITLADRIRKKIAAHRTTCENTELSVTVSCGVTEFSETSTRYEDLIRQADIALYASKNTGRNRVSRFSSDNCMPSP